VRGTAAIAFTLLLLLLASLPQAQGTAPATPLTLLSRDGRRQVPTIVLSGQELIALDEVASLFQVAVREDTLAGGLTITYRGRTIVVSSDQPMASVSGRVVALPSPAVRSGNRWFVPLDFLPRALAPIYDTRIDLRRASRLLVVGDLRVPRVTARVEVRAARRFKELRERGLEAIHGRVLADMKARDARDSARAVSPLEPAKDAIQLDTSDLDADQAFAAALDIIAVGNVRKT